MELYNDKHKASLDRIVALFMQGTPVSVAWSGGKDSSVLLDLTLAAATLAKQQGADPYILVTNGDTGVENPEIAAYVKLESQKILDYANQHGIRLDYHVAEPSLNNSFAVRIISGRALPSFPQTNHDCAVDWKVIPMSRLRKQLMKNVTEQIGKEMVTLVGTRFSESKARAQNMAERGDSHELPVRNANGDLVFTAIADWETDDVWWWVGLVTSGLIKSYSDFNDLKRIYADGGGTTCAVVSDTISEGMKQARGGCGARFGCMTCTAVKNDKSLNSMIEMDPDRYGYMEGPNKLREFIVKTQWDFDRRQWIGRSIDDNGMIAIRPDAYSPRMCLDLLRYALTIDALEREAAFVANLPGPRFELISLQSLVAIDAIWSLQGMHKPFQAIKEYIDIVENGVRYAVPEVQEYPRKPVPATRYLYVGDSWDQRAEMFNGLRDIRLEMLYGRDSVGGCMSHRTLKSGKIVLDVETEDTLNVDLEGAYLALDFERDSMMEVHERSNGKTRLTEGYRWWTRMGVISLAPQQVSMHDEILKRTSFKERIGIAGPDVSRDYLFSLAEQPKNKSVKDIEQEDSLSIENQPKSEMEKQFEQEDLFSVFVKEDEEEDSTLSMA